MVFRIKTEFLLWEQRQRQRERSGHLLTDPVFHQSLKRHLYTGPLHCPSSIFPMLSPPLVYPPLFFTLPIHLANANLSFKGQYILSSSESISLLDSPKWAKNLAIMSSQSKNANASLITTPLSPPGHASVSFTIVKLVDNTSYLPDVPAPRILPGLKWLLNHHFWRNKVKRKIMDKAV